MGSVSSHRKTLLQKNNTDMTSMHLNSQYCFFIRSTAFSLQK